MLKHLFIAVLLLSGSLQQANAQQIKLLSPSSSPKWDKVEIGIRLPQTIEDKVAAFLQKSKGNKGINPFDPQQLSIEAVFTAPDNSKKTCYGFYYNEFNRTTTEWVPITTSHLFRVRMAPHLAGNWSAEIAVVAEGKKEVLGNVTFNCTAGKNKGEVVATSSSSLSSKFLSLSENKEPFFAIGLNLVWTDLIKNSPADYSKYTQWMDKLANNGANYIQLSSLPFTHGIEWENLGDYSNRMNLAWEFDQLLDYCNQKGLYVNMLALIHDEFLTNPNIWIHQSNHWTNNPYNKNKNGGITNASEPADFFTDEKCKTLFKNRLRYLLSRYGYSTNLPIIELISEVDNAMEGYKDKTPEGAKKKANFKIWFNEMKSYIENDLGYSNKLISVSYTQNDQSEEIDKGVFADADIILLHFYGRGKQTNYTNRYYEHINKFAKNPKTKFKPILFDEMGANVFPGLDKCTDITFHINLWATSFMGTYGTGQNWWWDNAILPKGYETNFKGIHAFMKDENLTAKNFISKTWLNTGSKYKSKTKFEAFYLVSQDGEKALGWLHNTSFWWANQKNSNTEIATLIQNNNGSHIEQADNTAYGNEYKKGKATGAPQAYNGNKITIEGLSSSTEYVIKWYSTLTGELNGITEKVKSSSSGKAKFAIPDINPETNAYGDLGFKVVKFSR